ncbi:MAG: hypothetical protein EAX81_07310 [Candidatus Thorarchaeota archaeon]|nr:hypothetical protein [Candidatus Thorarchaeota archaeon]
MGRTLQKKNVMAIVIIIAIVGLGDAVVGFSILNLEPSQIPPPEALPSNELEAVTYDKIEVWATADYSIDFMPNIVGPEEPSRKGDPLRVYVQVNITNNGDFAVEGFDALRLTIYFNGTITPLVTLNLNPVEESEQCPLINPSESVMIKYTHSRETPLTPGSVGKGTHLYSRILVTWHGSAEHILTTCPSQLAFIF